MPEEAHYCLQCMTPCTPAQPSTAYVMRWKNCTTWDIKPANVMITPENRAVLLDLSIAREISSDQQDTRSLGTVGYAAPEQYGVAQSNRAMDLYALGVLLNTMITGVHPAVDIPRGPIRHIVQKATDTQISKRYKSAAAMARALRPYVRL